MPKIIRSLILRYGAAVVFVGAVFGLKLLLVPLVTQDIPFLLSCFAVTLSAWIGGFGPGMFATALVTVLDLYYFTHPFGSFTVASPDYIPRLGLFILEGFSVSLICAGMKAARRRVEETALEARELERQILELSDAEQRRIGHDLHDGLGQQLTGIAMITHRLERRLSITGSPEAQEAAKASELARGAVSWTRDLCRSLSPPVLERSGLAEALNELAGNVENIFHINCRCEHDPKFEFQDVSVSVHLYRIAQEAISNAIKHGKASNITMQLASGSAHDIILRIADDGQGITGSPAGAPGMGLRVMRYRANMIGAAIDVRDRPGGGTVVECIYAHRKTGSRNHQL